MGARRRGSRACDDGGADPIRAEPDPERPVIPSPPSDPSTAARLAAVRAGFTDAPDVDALDAAAHHADPKVRAAALGARVRLRVGALDAWRAACTDPDPVVRRRAAESAPRVDGPDPDLVVALAADADASVAEAAAWALGELVVEGSVADVIEATLDDLVRGHDDPLVREAAVAALGARGRGLTAILHACGDRPAVRRRAVLALAPFDGPEVTAALERALEDRDWQVRQAAEDLLGVDATAGDPEG
jgi:HEAT repeat protein